MAEYKVAQDVEAEDKLLGPFSFRQFIYLIIVAIAGALAWGLAQIFVGLAIIPLPIILFFGALALPLRKDQPMEVYLAALVSFYLKPRKRIWSPDGVESLIEITAPKTVEENRVKDLSQAEAERRLSYLANIADTGGWSIRHTANPTPNNSMNPDQFYAAQQTEDVLDDNGSIAHNFDAMISQSDQLRRQQLMQNMQNVAQAPQMAPQQMAQPMPAPRQQQYQGQPIQYDVPRQPQTYQPPVMQSPTQTIPPQQQPQNTPQAPQTLHYNPYPTIHQSVIQPLDADHQAKRPAMAANPAANQTSTPEVTKDSSDSSTSANQASPDIIGLANNKDLSIETIQREANRIKKKSEDEGEVFISLH